jgi:LmbE family N-acetylglucosaminyl deacetylase
VTAQPHFSTAAEVMHYQQLQRRIDRLRASVMELGTAEGIGLSHPDTRAAVAALNAATRELRRLEKEKDSD